MGGGRGEREHLTTHLSAFLKIILLLFSILQCDSAAACDKSAFCARSRCGESSIHTVGTVRLPPLFSSARWAPLLLKRATPEGGGGGQRLQTQFKAPRSWGTRRTSAGRQRQGDASVETPSTGLHLGEPTGHPAVLLYTHTHTQIRTVQSEHNALKASEFLDLAKKKIYLDLNVYFFSDDSRHQYFQYFCALFCTTLSLVRDQSTQRSLSTCTAKTFRLPTLNNVSLHCVVHELVRASLGRLGLPRNSLQGSPG